MMSEQIDWTKAPNTFELVIGTADTINGPVWFTSNFYMYVNQDIAMSKGFYQFDRPGNLKRVQLFNIQWRGNYKNSSAWTTAPEWALCLGADICGEKVWLSLDKWQYLSGGKVYDISRSHPLTVNLLSMNPKNRDRVAAVEHHIHVMAGNWNFNDGYEHPVIVDGRTTVITWIEFEAHKPADSRVTLHGPSGILGEELPVPAPTTLTTADEFLSAGLKILTERGQQYGSDNRECSFPQAAAAFNAITGHNLRGSDICLIVALIKQVRQYAQPERFHEDSAVDGVNYTALQAQELKRERGGV